MSRSQPLRIEDDKLSSFITSRTINSRLWFVNNPALEKRILGYLAKYQDVHGVILYATSFQGNHVHLVARFPKNNRAAFMRDLNARTAEAVRYTVKEYPGGPLFERRYSEQALVEEEDIESKFFYSALQPVKAGLCKRISEYPGFNSFSNAISNIINEYKVIDWAGYNKRRAYDPSARIRDYTKYYQLTFSRLPGYENLSQAAYKKEMLKKLEEERQKTIAEHLEKGTTFSDPAWLKKVVPGSSPLHTKKSRRYDYRPQFFCANKERRSEFYASRCDIYRAYYNASEAYLAGDEHVKFPSNTYKPPCFLIGSAAPPG